jgi:hypothetical protein
MISMIVDIKGTTTICFSVPYLSGFTYSQLEDPWVKTANGYNGVIAYSIVNPVTTFSTTGDSSVYVATYIAADSDMDMIVPCERLIPSGYTARQVYWVPGALPASGGWVAQAGPTESRFLKDIFAGEFPTLISGVKSQTLAFIAEGEKVRDVRTLLHRFQQHTTATVTLTNQTWTQLLVNDLVANYQRDDTFTLLYTYFFYHKGSMNWKLVRAYQATTEPNGGISVALGAWDWTTSSYPNPSTWSNQFGRNGTHFEEMSYKPSVEWKEPYHNTQALVGAPVIQLYSITETCSWVYFETLAGSSATTATYRVFRSVGDDFSMGKPLSTHVTWCYQ